MADDDTKQDKPKWYDCTCFHDCGTCSKTGRFHQHEQDPCPVHPDAEMTG